MVKRATLVAAACLVVILAVPFTTLAQDTSAWSTDPLVNTLLLKGGYYGMSIADDGSGGVIIVWAQSSYSGSSIYAQRLDKTGAELWSDNGVAVCTASGRRYDLVLVSDGSGGAIIAWSDFRANYAADVYAQRLDSAGMPQWDKDGTPICVAQGEQYVSDIESDGTGGAIITWSGYGNPDGYVFVQRVDSGGKPQWGESGVSLYSNPQSFVSPVMVTDGSGGAIVAWEDGFSWKDQERVYLQRVDSEGGLCWTPGGMVISPTPHDQCWPAIVSDESGGAIVSWTELRPAGQGAYGVYVQRLNPAGEPLWGTEGVLVQPGAGGAVMTSDGVGGAIVAWTDERNAGGNENGDIYAQRVDSDGTLTWEADGVAICTAPNSQVCPSVMIDGAGGAIIAWQDGRSSEATDEEDELGTDEVNVRHNDDIYAQRVDSAGTSLWAPDGVPICTAPHLQYGPAMVSTGSGSAVLIWADFRDYPLEGMHTDFNVAFDWYGQRVNASGALGPGSGGDAGLPAWAWIAIAAGAVAVVGIALLAWRRVAAKKRAPGSVSQPE